MGIVCAGACACVRAHATSAAAATVTVHSTLSWETVVRYMPTCNHSQRSGIQFDLSVSPHSTRPCFNQRFFLYSISLTIGCAHTVFDWTQEFETFHFGFGLWAFHSIHLACRRMLNNATVNWIVKRIITRCCCACRLFLFLSSLPVIMFVSMIFAIWSYQQVNKASTPNYQHFSSDAPDHRERRNQNA